MRRFLPLFALLLFQFLWLRLNAQWQSTGSGISASPRSVYGMSAVDADVVWAITIHPSYAAPAREFTRTANGGTTWQSGVIDATNGGDFTALNVFAMDANTAWVVMTDNSTQRLGRIYKTSNGGQMWSEQTGTFNNLNNAIQAVHFFDTSTGIAYGSPATGDPSVDSLRIWRTTNGGTTWSRIPTTSLPTPLAGEGIINYYGNGLYDVVGDTVWFGTQQGRVWRSINRGSTWKAFTVSSGVPIYSVAFTDAKNGLAISDGIGFRTLDGGATWNQIPMPAAFLYYQIENVPAANGIYVLVYEGSNNYYTNFKMAYTLNDGDTWEPITSSDVECIEFLSPTIAWGGGYITSASSGGMYRWTGNLQGVTAIAEAGLVRKDIRSYPNPFTDFTMVEFETQSTAPVAYVITDIAGKVVKSGVIDRPMVGKNQAAVALDAPAGLYLLTIKQQDSAQTLKLIKR